MQFKILYKERAIKDLKKLPQLWQNKLLSAIEFLKTDPFGGKKLRGKLFGAYSLRVWPYRILYEIDHDKIIVIVLHIGHRQGVYK